MIFPYLRGMVFCAKLTNDGGWKAIDEAYRNPPLSTEQILHPEKYRAKPDSPMSIDLGALDAGRGLEGGGPQRPGRDATGRPAPQARRQAGRRRLGRRPLRRLRGPEEPARPGLALHLGQRGRRPRVHARPMSGYQTTKLGNIARPPRPIPDTVWRNVGDRLYVVQRRGLDVAVVEGFPPSDRRAARGRLPGQEDRDETGQASVPLKPQPRITPQAEGK